MDVPGEFFFYSGNRLRCYDLRNDIEDLSNILKEMQPRLQLTEDQYNYWSTKEQVLLVEFDRAHKIDVIRVASKKIVDQSDWIAFEDSSLIT